VGGALNSGHQAGDAVDLNPFSQPSDWPAMVPGCLNNQTITTFIQAQQALTCLGKQQFNAVQYFVDFHGNHLHINRRQ
jgi:hypothetical protein